MTTVVVSGWNPGFNKVGFTKLLQTVLGLSLSHAKRMTDSVLETGTVECQVPENDADEILSAMERLGAKCAAAVNAQ